MNKNERWCGSFGAFVNVTRFEPDSWRSQLHNVRALSNYDHIEVWCEWMPETLGQLNELRATFKGEQLLMHAPFVGISLVSPWSELRTESIKRLTKAATLANALEAKVMTIHPGIAPVFEHRPRLLDRVTDGYKAIRETLDETQLALENMPDRRTATVEGVVSMDDFSEILSRDSTIKFTLDVGHALQNDDKYREFLFAHTASIINMHLHDGVAGGAGHLRIGTGQLDIHEYLRLCQDSNYSGFVSLETLGIIDTSASWNVVRRALAT